MLRRRSAESGQALVMVTISLVAMLGMLGLAVDFGWAYFVRRAAQGAADAAALAAVEQALASGVETAVVAGAPVNCPASGNLTNGCLYAQKNGYAPGGAVTVTMESDLGATRQPPTAPGVSTIYWATARVRENIPQLFSSVLGRMTGVSGARATAAVVETQLIGSLILLNRQRDCIAMNGPNSTVCGVNLNAQGSAWVNAPGGILMASTRHGDDLGIPGDSSRWAGQLGGSAWVKADFTAIRGAGTANVAQGDPDWDKPWQNGVSDGMYFKDPMRTIGKQPAAPAAGLPGVAQPGCVIQGGSDASTTLVLNPGRYYAEPQGGCQWGDPLEVRGHVHFAAGGDGFGDFVFFGGLKTTSSANITFDPGRYVFAGSKPQGGKATPSFDVSSGQVVIQDNTPLGAGGDAVPNTDAGEIFIFTDTTYPGLETAGIPSNALSPLKFGSAGFQAGNNNKVLINLHGLNKAAAEMPDNLDPFSPVVMWQDQRNSVVKYYNADGTMNSGCITGDSPSGCTQTLANPNSPELSIQASPNINLYGVVYQPRGAWTKLSGGSGYSGPLQLIAGAVDLQGGADLNLQSLATPILMQMVALIE